MRKFIVPVIFALLLLITGIHNLVLSDKCTKLQQELIRQDMLLLKQSKILAVNTVLLKTLVSDRQSKKPETLKSGKEGLKIYGNRRSNRLFSPVGASSRR